MKILSADPLVTERQVGGNWRERGGRAASVSFAPGVGGVL